MQPALNNPKEKIINQISLEIREQTDLSLSEERLNQIAGFIFSTINGDIPSDQLVLNGNIGDIKGLIIFVLTNNRLIKFEIDKEEIKAATFLLKTLIGIERSLTKDDREHFKVNFPSGSFGLSYPQENIQITEFFQKIESIGG